MEAFDWLRNPEINLIGFFIPWWWMIGTAGFLLAWLAAIALEQLGWTRSIWHLPLFFLALAAFFSSVLGLLLAP